MAKKPTRKATTPNAPKTFKLATRWGVIINGALIEVMEEKPARAFARMLYADAKTYANAVRKKEIAVMKVDIRPVKKK